MSTIGRRTWDVREGESDENHITVWSALYNLSERSVTWVSNQEYDNPDAVFRFEVGK